MENNTTNFAAQNSASAPVQSAASAPVSYNQGGTKKSSSILTIVFLITTLGFAGAFAWAMLRDTGGTKADTASTTCAVTEEEVAAAEEGTVAEVVANYDTDKEIRDLVKGLINYMDASADVASPRVMTADSGTVLAKLDSGIYTSIPKSYGAYVDSSVLGNDPFNTDKINAYSNVTVAYLESKGFTKVTELSGDYGFYYDKDSMRCAFTYNTMPFSIVCASTDWVTDSQKTLVSALHDAYASKNPDNTTTNVFNASADRIQTSESGKYETLKGSTSFAGAPFGGGYALYYREVGSTEWIYVLGGNGIPNCSDFDEAATEAFTNRGIGCLDENNNLKNVGE